MVKVHLEDRFGGELGTARRSRTDGRVPLGERLGRGVCAVGRREDPVIRGKGPVDSYEKVDALRRALRSVGSGKGDLRHRLSAVNQTSGDPLLCRFFKQGRCTWGNECNFKHEVEISSGAIQPERRKRRQPGIQYFNLSTTARGSYEWNEKNVSTSSEPKDGENNEHDIKDRTHKIQELNKDSSYKKAKLHIEMGREGIKPRNDQKLVENEKHEDKARLINEIQKLEDEITRQRDKRPREETDKMGLIDEVQRLERAVRRKQKQMAPRLQTSPRRKHKKLCGRRVIMKARKGEANMENSGKVTPAERKSMSPITRFLESDHARSPSTCSDTLEKSPRSNAGAEHPHTDASSPAAAFSRSVTSEENLIQDLENCWDILNRKAQEVEQKCPSNDTLEMCVSEREREELSGLTNWEGSSGTGFGDWKAKGLVKNKNESQRNQRQQKLSVMFFYL